MWNEPSETISGRIAFGKVVYAWRRGSTYLYVGYSSKGIGRIGSGHHKINIAEPVKPTDSLDVWDCSQMSEKEAKDLESDLIQHLKPKYNYQLKPGMTEQRRQSKLEEAIEQYISEMMSQRLSANRTESQTSIDAQRDYWRSKFLADHPHFTQDRKATQISNSRESLSNLFRKPERKRDS